MIGDDDLFDVLFTRHILLVVSSHDFWRPEDRESSSTGLDTRFLGDLFQWTQQFGGARYPLVAHHLFTCGANQRVNQSPAGTFLCAWMVGRHHNGNTRTVAPGQEFYSLAI